MTRYAWALVLMAAAGAAVWWLLSRSARANPRLRLRLGWERLRRRLGIDEPLCRTCKWNNPRDCRRGNRPHARICEDYRRR